MSEFIDVGDRIYEVFRPLDLILGDDGGSLSWRVDKDTQRIFVDGNEPEKVQNELLAEAAAAALPISWRQIPVVGLIS